MIGYNREAKRTSRVTLLRPRAIAYAALFVLCLSAGARTLLARQELVLIPFRAQDIPYQILNGANGGKIVTNHFRIEIRNQSLKKYQISIEPSSEEGVKVITAFPETAVQPGVIQSLDVFVEFPLERASSSLPVLLNAAAGGKTQSRAVTLNLISPRTGSSLGMD